MFWVVDLIIKKYWCIFKIVLKQMPSAIKNSKTLYKIHNKPEQNHSTSVFILVEELLNFYLK